MANYYNEIDLFAAEWLRNLMKKGLIPDGEVDTRSISDVVPNDLAGFTQCHFFAGIAGWSHALRLAGWPDDRPIWTGSCPCQPFSVAGKGKGTADERHLWPVFFNLIRECRPPVVMGEQVSGKAGYGWLDGVRADLEAEDYACRGIDIPACAVDAPHIRQRLYWVALADTVDKRCDGFDALLRPDARGRDAQDISETARSRAGSDMVDAEGFGRREGRTEYDVRSGGPAIASASCGHMADANNAGRQGWQLLPKCSDKRSAWSNSVEWRRGADGKTRRVKSGVCLLADGLSANLERLRAIEQEAWGEIVRHANSCGSNPNEAMRVLREGLLSEAHREEQAVGVCFQLHETPLLLDFLLCVDAARDRAADSRRISEEVDEARGRIVRGMRSHREAGRPSCERRPDEQLSGEFADPMLALSFVLARLAETYRQAARDANASSSRVGKLRAFGNAIVPPLAAEVIKAFMDV